MSSLIERAIRKGNKAIGDAIHDGADDGKESVAFFTRKGKFVHFDAKENQE
jgi:hypothetical protein